jgi:hypothetical protein
MTTTMLGSYNNESGVGVEEPCLKFNMKWEGYPLKSKFNAKLVQYPHELIPRFYIKKEIFERDMMPSWAIRKICVFNFEFIDTSYIDQFLGELWEDDPREPNMTCFRIVSFKVRNGGDFFYPLRAGKYGGTETGLEDNNRMGLDKYSFDREVGIIHYSEFPGNLVWEFYFGYDDVSEIYDLNEESAELIRLRNLLYISKSVFTTGTIESIIQEVTFTPLITPLEEISIYTKIFPSWIQIYNSLGNSSNEESDQLLIPAGSTDTYQYSFKPLDVVINGTLPILMTSEDLIYKTYNERLKIIEGRTFYVVNVRTGIDGDIYMLHFNIFDFKVVNDFNQTIATLELGGSTTFYIRTLPENVDVLNLIDPNITIYFTFANINPHLLYVPETIAWPKRDILGNRIEPTFVARSYGITSERDEFEIKISTVSENFYWNKIDAIPSIQVNIANLYITNTKLLIDIADQDNIIYSNDVQIRPKRYEDVTDILVLDPNIQVSSADFITFNYTSVFVDNKFILTEADSDATMLSNFDYDIPLTAKQGDTIYIDTSDPSNFGQKITFYDINQNYGLELKNEDGEVLAEYSRNFPQGTENSYISITLPLDRNIVYFRNQPYNPREAYWQYGFGSIDVATLELKEIGDFTFTNIDGTQEGGRLSLVSNDVQGQVDIQMGIADNELFADTNLGIVTVRTIKVTPPINPEYDIKNDSHVYLSWSVEEYGKTIYDFANPALTRYTTNVSYEILRLTYESGTPEYVKIGESDKAEYIDTTATRYGNYRYKIKSIITWQGVSITSDESQFAFVFVCQNNQFPYGRWNNTTQNPKLYKNISGTCNEIGMTTRFPLAGNLFPNSATMTKAEVYSMLAKGRATTR